MIPPSGNHAHKPLLWMKDGKIVEVEIKHVACCGASSIGYGVSKLVLICVSATTGLHTIGSIVMASEFADCQGSLVAHQA